MGLLGGKQKQVGGRQDLKLGTAHEEGVALWSRGWPNRKAQLVCAVDPSLIGANVILLQHATTTAAVTRAAIRLLQAPWPGHAAPAAKAHIVQAGKGEDRLTCQSRQDSSDPCQHHSSACHVAPRETRSDKHPPSSKYATEWWASGSSIGCVVHTMAHSQLAAMDAFRFTPRIVPSA